MTNAQVLNDPTHPQHAKLLDVLGKFAGLALLGLAAYQQQDVSPNGAAVFLSPATVAPYLQGLLSVFSAQPAQQ